MDRALASIQLINNLEPIKKKDRIELATIQGWTVIVEKGKYRIGDKVIYIQYDTILPIKPEFEFLRKRCYSPRYNGFRIRNMSMGGVFSQGIVFDISLVPVKDRILHKDVSKQLGIRKYDPEAIKALVALNNKPKNSLIKLILKYSLTRRIYSFFSKRNSLLYPKDISKSRETNIQVAFNSMDKDTVFYLTEKLEGSAATYENRVYRTWYGKPKNIFRVYSHNTLRPKEDDSIWWRIARQENLQEKLKGRNLVIQGEIVGEGIQKNIYKLPEIRFYIYGMKYLNLPTSPIQLADLIYTSTTLRLQLVPMLEQRKLFQTIPEILKHAEGQSKLNKETKREGVVWRDIHDHRIGFKAKSISYLKWWDKNA